MKKLKPRTYNEMELFEAIARRQPTIVLSTRDQPEFRITKVLKLGYDVELIGEVVPYDGGRRRRAMTEADEAGNASVGMGCHRNAYKERGEKCDRG